MGLPHKCPRTDLIQLVSLSEQNCRGRRTWWFGFKSRLPIYFEGGVSLREIVDRCLEIWNSDSTLCLKGKPERVDCLKSVFTEVQVGWKARESAGLYRQEPSVKQVLKT